MNFRYLIRQRNDTDVSLDPQLKGRYEIHDKEHNFIIKHPDVKDAGIYTCTITELQESAAIIVVGTLKLQQC